MLPIFVLIKIFTYLSKQDRLKLRVLNKRIAAVFRPKKIFLNEESAHLDIKHIKKVICHKLFKFLPILENNPQITKLITNHNIKKRTNVKLLNYLKNLTYLEYRKKSLADISIFENLVFYKGPHNHYANKLVNLKSIYLTETATEMHYYIPGLKKFVICGSSNNAINILDLRCSYDLKHFVLKINVFFTEFYLPYNVKTLKAPYFDLFYIVKPNILYHLEKLYAKIPLFEAPKLKKLKTQDITTFKLYKISLECLHYYGDEILDLSGMPFLRKVKTDSNIINLPETAVLKRF